MLHSVEQLVYLQARLKPIYAWQNSDVVLLIKDIVSGPIFLISILSRHVANYLPSVSIPKLFPECFDLFSIGSTVATIPTYLIQDGAWQ